MDIIDIPEQRIYQGRVFPLTLSRVGSVTERKEVLLKWIIENRYSIDTLLRQHRCILLRNHGLQTAQDFHDVVEATGLKSMDYVGGAAVRTQITSRVFTANESPASERIPFHHEMAQTPDPPSHLFFFCEASPPVGGETPLLVSHEVYERLHALSPEYMDKIERLGIQYFRVMPEEDDPTSAIGRGWKSTFLCNDKEGAEEKLRSLGSTWKWLPNGDLETITAVVPAIRIDNLSNLRSMDKTFFNSMVAAYTGWNDSRNSGETAVRLADGSYIEKEFMEAAVRIMDEICVAFKWQPGDCLIVDNRTAMHSRRPFEGHRRILAALSRDPSR